MADNSNSPNRLVLSSASDTLNRIDPTANVTPLRVAASQPKERTAAAPTRRFRRQKRKAGVTRTVTPALQPAVTPVTRHGGIDIAAYMAAIALAGAAAWFSIRGLAVLFPGSPVSVIGMAVAMEGAKLITAGWLARRWRATAWFWRLILVALVAGLAVINATGVYAQLVAAHVGERGAATSAIETPGCGTRRPDRGCGPPGRRRRPAAQPGRRRDRGSRQARQDQYCAFGHRGTAQGPCRPRRPAPARGRGPLPTSRPSALHWAPEAGRSRLRLRRSATWPSSSAPTPTANGRYGGSLP